MGTWLRDLTPRSRKRLAWFGGVLMTLGLVGIIALIFAGAGTPSTQKPPAPPSVVSGPADGLMKALPPENQAHLRTDLVDMRGMTPVVPATSTAHPAVDAESKSQADLYAAKFVTGLLTQDYRTDRGALLSWVQSEQTSSMEPTFVGLIPVDLRPKFAVWSVTVASGGNPVIPSKEAWAALGAQNGTQTVRVTRVTQPVSWATAVAAGQIADPGAANREVDAVVTLKTTTGKVVTVKNFSVAVNIAIQAKPAGYGFVAVAIYDIAEMEG